MKKVFYDFSLDSAISGRKVERRIYNLLGRDKFCFDERERSSMGIGFYWGVRKELGHSRYVLFFCSSDGLDSPLYKRLLYSDLRIVVMKDEFNMTEKGFAALLDTQYDELYVTCKELAELFCNSA